MPLVERYNDWNISDSSFDDPHTLEFDHRIDADASSITGLPDIEKNVKATGVITVLRPEFGWNYGRDSWVYDPSLRRTNLISIWRDHLASCLRHDRDSLKGCFCNTNTDPATAYTGPEAPSLSNSIDALEWPSDATELTGRFPLSGQHMIGPKFCSAYHLGNGYMGTAGHCLDGALTNNQLSELRVVFNWTGSVASKTFTESEVFEIEKVMLCDTHGPAPSLSNPIATASWSRRWDSAIFKLKGTTSQLSLLPTIKYSVRPPEFRSPVYNVGCPLGTQLKVSVSAHVLRHCLIGDDDDPFSHLIAGYGTMTTDLDQFEGNSGGPVFDVNTGLLVGHTSSTQDAVAESDVAAIESWANEYAQTSNNFALAAKINRILESQEPNNKLYRVHPKFLRTLSGKTTDSPLIKCATIVCPGDIGPNKKLQLPGRHQAVFSRHHFNSKDVYMRNISARIDRSAIFITPLDTLLRDHGACILTLKLAGKTEVFREPNSSSTLILTINSTEWKLRDMHWHKSPSSSVRPGLDLWSATANLTAQHANIPRGCLCAPRGLIEWTKVRLVQPTHNPPTTIGIHLSIHRPSFPFPVHKDWPPDKPAVATDPAPHWPAENFEFATTAGGTSGIPQTGDLSDPATERNDGDGVWTWEAPLTKVWTNPRQPSQGLRDPLVDDIDAMLA